MERDLTPDNLNILELKIYTGINRNRVQAKSVLAIPQSSLILFGVSSLAPGKVCSVLILGLC